MTRKKISETGSKEVYLVWKTDRKLAKFLSRRLLMVLLFFNYSERIWVIRTLRPSSHFNRKGNGLALFLLSSFLAHHPFTITSDIAGYSDPWLVPFF
jgi:hypothetical protein